MSIASEMSRLLREEWKLESEIALIKGRAKEEVRELARRQERIRQELRTLTTQTDQAVPDGNGGVAKAEQALWEARHEAE